MCPSGTLSFCLPPDFALHAGPAYFIIHNRTFVPAIEFVDSNVALASIDAASISVDIMQVWL
jgi:hypothetical protein